MLDVRILVQTMGFKYTIVVMVCLTKVEVGALGGAKSAENLLDLNYFLTVIRILNLFCGQPIFSLFSFSLEVFLAKFVHIISA